MRPCVFKCLFGFSVCVHACVCVRVATPHSTYVLRYTAYGAVMQRSCVHVVSLQASQKHVPTDKRLATKSHAMYSGRGSAVHISGTIAESTCSFSTPFFKSSQGRTSQHHKILATRHNHRTPTLQKPNIISYNLTFLI